MEKGNACLKKEGVRTGAPKGGEANVVFSPSVF